MLQLCIVLLVIGILALTLEIIMPGYDGFIGAVVGIAALVASAVLAIMFVDGGWVFVAIIVCFLAVCGCIARMYIRRGQLHGKIMLSESLAEDLPTIDFSSLVGKEGKTITTLRPSGEVDFNGIRVQVTTGGPMVERGTLVQVTEAQPQKVLVRVVNGNS